MPVLHLSQNTWMSQKQTIGKRDKTVYSVGKNLQGIKKVVLIAPKHNHCGLGYQSGNREKNGRIGKQRENRMAIFKVQKNSDRPLIVPPLHQTFRSGGYVNSSLSVEHKD